MKAFRVIDQPQRSAAWFQARLGRVTGTSAKHVLATVQKGEAAARRDLRIRLVCERLTGRPQEEPYANAAMERGIECEPLAFAAYEALTGDVVTRTGFLAHTVHQLGCSLDGHVGDFAGIVELKCPATATHVRYLRAGGIPAEHLAQITHNLLVSGADWCDFLSWDDRLPPKLQTFLVRVHRTDVDLAGYETKVLAFLAEVEQDLASLVTLSNVSGALRASVEAAHAV